VNKKTNTQQPLPFDITLTEFQVICYEGTQAPSDYVSQISIRKDQEESTGQISMNKIYSKDGYRFYQSGYDHDQQGSILMVKTDRFGLPVTYGGYALLLIGMIGFFFSKNTGFRQLLKHPALKKGAMVLLMFLTCHGAMAEERVLSKETARKFGEIQMLYHDRITPIQTFAKEFTLKLYGKPTYNSLTSEQILSSWILYPEDWMRKPMIKIKNKQIRKMLGISGKYATFADFFTDSVQYKLADPIRRIHAGEELESMKDIIAADEKVQLIIMLRMGIPLTIFPQMENGELIWYSPADDLPANMPQNEQLLIMGYFDLLHDYARENDMAGLQTMLEKLKVFQYKKAGNMLPSTGKIKAERLYNNLNIAKPIAFANILLGFFALIYFFRRKREEHETPTSSSKIITLILNILLIIAWIGILTLIGLRGYVSGHIPLGGGYETMQFLAVCIMLLAFLFQRKFFLFLPFGFIFSGLVLLVSGMGASNPQITQLQPVLVSPLLSAHVSLVMMAYTLFGFITLNSISALFHVILSGKNKSLSGVNQRLTHLSVISRILLYPAIFLMAAGIFVGAVWAEVSWGIYWSWDPKEVWALITLIVYAIALHVGSLPTMRKPLTFHIYTLFAFLSVLMTYFGVNYILGGQHSYGATFARSSVFWVVLSILVVFIVLPLSARIRHGKKK
jgi:ABC-type transport system involved in cytochrome c biogenesis permease subunit